MNSKSAKQKADFFFAHPETNMTENQVNPSAIQKTTY